MWMVCRSTRQGPGMPHGHDDYTYQSLRNTREKSKIKRLCQHTRMLAGICQHTVIWNLVERARVRT